MKNKIKKIVALALIAFISVGVTAGTLAIVKNDLNSNNGVADATIAITEDNTNKAVDSTQNSITNNITADNNFNNAYDVITLANKEEALPAQESNISDTGSSSNVLDGAYLFGAYINSAKDFLNRYNTNNSVVFAQKPVELLTMAVEDEMPLQRVAYSRALEEDVLYVGTENRFKGLVEAPGAAVAAKAQVVSENNNYDDLAAFVKWHLFKENNGDILRAIYQLNKINNGSNYDAWMTFSSEFTDYKYGNMYPKEVANTMNYRLDKYELVNALEQDEDRILVAEKCDQVFASNAIKKAYVEDNDDFVLGVVREDSIIASKRAARRINPFERIVKAYIDAENTKKQMAINLFDHYNDMLNEYNRKLNEYVETVYNSFWHFKAPKAAKKAYVAEAVCAKQEVAIAAEIPQEAFAYKVLKEEFIPDEKATFLLVDEAKDAELDCAEAAAEMVDALADAQPAAAEPEPAAEAPVEVEFPPAAQAAPEMVAVQQAAE